MLDAPGIVPGIFRWQPDQRLMFDELSSTSSVTPDLHQLTLRVAGMAEPARAAREYLRAADAAGHRRDTILVLQGALYAPACDWNKVVTDLRGLASDWDGFGAHAPNATAELWARTVLRLCSEGGLEPNNVAPSSEGGIAISFRVDGMYGDIECYNDGSLLASFDDGRNQPETWPIAIDEIDLRSSLDAVRTRLGI